MKAEGMATLIHARAMVDTETEKQRRARREVLVAEMDVVGVYGEAVVRLSLSEVARQERARWRHEQPYRCPCCGEGSGVWISSARLFLHLLLCPAYRAECGAAEVVTR